MESNRPYTGLRIDVALDAPVYRQIATQLEDAIVRGERVPGERLPAIRTLAAELGLHRDTVALAYERLAHAGMSVRKNAADHSVAFFMYEVESYESCTAD